jgi:peptidoglycan/xylan/chitin deacetylase (PgdA/CDA1 family)
LFYVSLNFMKNGAFIISLDFELYWGVRDTRSLQSYTENILGVREAIPAMLDIFDRYEVKSTIAAVGFLFCSGKKELIEYLPSEFPTYKNSKLSPYADYLNNLGKSESDDPYHFAPTLIKMIFDRKKHEMSTHTFSHYYCLEDGQTPHQFREDIKSANKVASLYGIKNRSIIFPRNQYSEEYLQVCHDEELIAFRGNEHSWIYEPRNRKNESGFRRALRLIDSYINISGMHIHSPYEVGGLCNIPSSRFLRPYNRNLAWLDGLRLNRIKNQMTAAAKAKKIFHLWWHPHNFGNHLKQNLAFLEKILSHYKTLHQSTGFVSMTMEEASSEFINSKKI